MSLTLDVELLPELNILVGLILTAALITLIADWRIALSALVAQYVLVAMLLTAQILVPTLAIVRVISGTIAAVILYLTMRRITSHRARDFGTDNAPQEVFVVGIAFRLFSLALVAVGIIGIASSMTFLGLAPHVLFSGFWLITAGILVAILSRNVPRLGLGILMFTNGFCILESSIGGGLFLYGLINISDLLLAVTISHLATVSPDTTPTDAGEIP